MESNKCQFDPTAENSTAKRLLCPTDKISDIIDKSGSIVSKIRDEPRSKISINDPVLGSDDRVIFIAAESSSLAQMTVVRIWERIEELEEGREASCRLLVSRTQVGCVLGKGGKIVKRIRDKSGAQVRILVKEQLTACAGAGDELIWITGSLSAVRRALLSVSSCLQGSPKTKPTNFGRMRSIGATPNGSGVPVTVDPGAHRSYVPSVHATDYHSRMYSLSPGIEATTYSHRKVLEENVVFRMLYPKDRVASIIGKADIIVRTLQK